MEETFLKESSLSRVYQHTLQHDAGTITAFRYGRDCGEGEKYTNKENRDRNAKLKKELLAKGYGVTAIKGTYIENYNTPEAREVDEESYLVVDLKDKGTLKKDLIKLGEKYEQDSITYAPAGNKEFYLIGTNKCPAGYPGYHKELELGKPLFGKNGEFYSKVNGRPFVFESVLSTNVQLTDYPPTEIRGILAIIRGE
jgi:hypothetical protein